MWHKIFFNIKSVKGETNRSLLIKMPNNSHYKGWLFWHPAKLVRTQGGKGFYVVDYKGNICNDKIVMNKGNRYQLKYF